MASYINERLEIGIIYETVGSPVGWDTTIINRDNGFYLPIERQSDSIGRWNIGDRRFSKKEWEYLLAFFYNVRGSAIAFKYKDWSDYQAINQPIADADGVETEFQLIKTYGDYFKPIYKPITATVKIYLDGVLQTSGYTVNSVGLITFTTAPDSGVAIAANFEFDLVVRFENDTLTSRFDAYDPNHREEALYNVPSIFLIEVLPISSVTFASDRWKFQGGACIIDPSGIYDSQAECEADNPIPWKCENGVCIQDLSGIYESQAECEAALISAGFTGGQCSVLYKPLVIRTFVYQNGLGATITDVSLPQNNGSLSGPLSSWEITLGSRASNGFGRIFTETRVSGIAGSSNFVSTQTAIDFGKDSFGNRFNRTFFAPDEVYYKLISASIQVVSLTRADGQPDNCGNPPPICPP